MAGKRRKASRGSDDPFYRLMKVGAGAVLKLIGIDSPEEYTARAFVLKEKKLYSEKYGKGKTFGHVQGMAGAACRCLQKKGTGDGSTDSRTFYLKPFQKLIIGGGDPYAEF